MRKVLNVKIDLEKVGERKNKIVIRNVGLYVKKITKSIF